MMKMLLRARRNRWKVGNGRHIIIDQDPWADMPGSEIPTLLKDKFKGKQVKEILGDNGDWDPVLVFENFTTIEAETILNTPTGGKDSRD